jgi:hypothetical protein
MPEPEPMRAVSSASAGGAVSSASAGGAVRSASAAGAVRSASAAGAVRSASAAGAVRSASAAGAVRERRRRRSDDTITALHYQLSHTRSEGRLEAVVLVDDTGCLVAGAGAWPVCEELAAFAPLLADRRAVGSAAVGGRLADIESEVFVSPLSVDGCEALICGRGSDSTRAPRAVHPALAELIARAADGCRRILETGA